MVESVFESSTQKEAEEKLDILLELAKQNNIEVHFDKSILRWENLFKLDDEMSEEPNIDDLDY